MPTNSGSMNKETVMKLLNELLEREYSGVVRYSHYSLMVFGYNRIPIVGWFRDQAKESLTHAERIGEMITALDGHPSLKISKLLETHRHSISEILEESLQHEREQLQGLHDLLKEVEGKNVWLEEFTRLMIVDEEDHCAEVEKMLKSPGK